MPEDQPQSEDTVLIGDDKTRVVEEAECPVCFSMNPAGTEWCAECGFWLAGEPVRPSAPLPQMPKLVAADEPSREYHLNEGENTVGRESADILLTNPTVSRKHARITVEGESVWLVDLQSANGTCRNGEKIPPGERVLLAHDDELMFGNQRLMLVVPCPSLPGPSEPVAAPALPAPEPDSDARLEGVPQPEPEPAASVTASLILVAESPAEYPLREGLNGVGRRGDNEVTLPFDQYISGRHANIILRPDGCFIEDVGSRNGTWVNAVRIETRQSVELHDGDLVTVGQTKLRVSLRLPESEGIDLPEK